MWLKKIRMMKEKSGLTTKEIAIQSKIPEPTLEKLFAGVTKDPKLETMKQLVHFFGYSLDDLDDTSNKDTNISSCLEPKGTKSLSSEEKQHIKKYRLLDQHGQKAVNSVLDVEYERCSKVNDKNNLVEIPYVARSETGERGTIVKTQEEIDEFLKKLNPDTSGQY